MPLKFRVVNCARDFRTFHFTFRFFFFAPLDCSFWTGWLTRRLHDFSRCSLLLLPVSSLFRCALSVRKVRGSFRVFEFPSEWVCGQMFCYSVNCERMYVGMWAQSTSFSLPPTRKERDWPPWTDSIIKPNHHQSNHQTKLFTGSLFQLEHSVTI